MTDSNKSADKETKTTEGESKFDPRPNREFFAGTKIHLLADTNPRREGTHAFNSYALIEEGMDSADFFKAGGRLHQLRVDCKRGYLSVSRDGETVEMPNFEISKERPVLTDEEKEEKKKKQAEARKAKADAKKEEKEKAKAENPPGDGKKASGDETLGDGKSGTIQDGEPAKDEEKADKKKK